MICIIGGLERNQGIAIWGESGSVKEKINIHLKLRLMSKKQERIEEAIRKLLSEDSNTVIKAVLENLAWPREVDTDTRYFVREDDGDGVERGISVHFLSNGDGVLDLRECCIESHFAESSIYSTPHLYRFRDVSGGSMNPLIQKALLLLALIIANDPDKEIKNETP